MTDSTPLYRLQCGVNSYDWGKIGQESQAAKFAAATPADGFTIQSGKPYAELWMGTHPSNPSKILESGRTLLDLVESDPKILLGEESNTKYGAKLPFLFKVLSINKALSIQAHPNKNRAEELHAKDPKNYPDDNHKPEMAIAITPFEGLCGFRPLPEIAHFLESVPALRGLVGEDVSKDFIAHVQKSNDPTEVTASNKEALKIAFAALMKSSQEDVASATKTLVADANKEADFANGGVQSTDGKTMAGLVTRLNEQFPDDIGLFVLFFLNYVKLDIGEALFLKADDIHAYVSGDIMECMAASDNVVRAGFTPKFKDVDTLVDLLTYDFAPIEEQKMEPKDSHKWNVNGKAATSQVMEYDPPIDEFKVIRSELERDGAAADFWSTVGPSIVICTQGKGTISILKIDEKSGQVATDPKAGESGRKIAKKTEEATAGYVFFVGAGERVELRSKGGDEPFITFLATYEPELPTKSETNGNGANL